MRPRHTFKAGLFASVVIFATAGTASELTYKPLHPAYGGDPNNFNALINLAQIQNRHEAASGGGGGAPAINFPPITIDLGGVGGATDPLVDPQTPAARQSVQPLVLKY